MTGSNETDGAKNAIGQVIDVVSKHRIDTMPYSSFWLQGTSLRGRPTRTATRHGEISFCAWYPKIEYSLGGIVLDRTFSADKEVLTAGVHLLDEEVAIDNAVYGQMRAEFDKVVADEGLGGYGTAAENFCADKNVPFATIAFWKIRESDKVPSYASFHPTIIVPPLTALKSLQFALWRHNQ